MRGLHHTIRSNRTYFMTHTDVDWIDIFTRANHKELLVESMKYCQRERGLYIYAWCLMPSHLHMIANTRTEIKMSDVMRDFKKYTSKKIVKQIQDEPESRRKWLLNHFEFAGRYNPKIKDFKFWQEGTHPIELFSEKVMWQKIEYIHRNPVEAGFVYREEVYLYSSARNYHNLPSVMDVELITPRVMTVDKPGFFNV